LSLNFQKDIKNISENDKENNKIFTKLYIGQMVVDLNDIILKIVLRESYEIDRDEHDIRYIKDLKDFNDDAYKGALKLLEEYNIKDTLLKKLKKLRNDEGHEKLKKYDEDTINLVKQTINSAYETKALKTCAQNLVTLFLDLKK